MSRQSIRYDVRLTLTAPILTQASGAIGFGLDAAMLRDPQGRPAFYQSHIKGKLREAWATLRKTTGLPNVDFTNRWLGMESDSGSDDAPIRGQLSFDAFWPDRAWKDGAPSSFRYRVLIDPKTGAVDSGALQIIESPWPSGTPVVFAGSIYARTTIQEHDELLKYLRLGFHLIPELGALKGNGFGRIASADIDAKPILPDRRPLKAELLRADRVGLRISPCAPFCFAQLASGSQNAFVAEEHIPGAAVIAGLQRRIEEEPQRFPNLKSALDVLAVSNARPVIKGRLKRSVAVPLSLIKLSNGFRDVSAGVEPGRIDGEVPAFCIDWKEGDWNSIEMVLNPDSRDSTNSNANMPGKYLLIRTEIDSDTQTSAESKLFSTEMVVPDGCEWLANLDLSQAGDPEKVLREIVDLLSEPLTHLGKTKTRATVRMEKPFDYSVASMPIAEPIVSIHLQSPAALLPDNFAAPATNGGAALHAAYARAWTELSGNALSLSHFFASQQLFGGTYWWKRYRQSDKSWVGGYRPRVMTSAGSVFILRVLDIQGAQDHIAGWLRRGLPQLQGTPGGECWEYNPWIGANGFGEIAVNLDLEAALKPRFGEPGHE